MNHELQGTGYDPGARGHELQGRANLPPLPTPESLSQQLRAENAHLFERFEAFKAAFDRVPVTITTEEEAGKAADFAAQLASLNKTAGAKRVEHKKPFDELAAVPHGLFGAIETWAGRARSDVLNRAGAYQAEKREAERKRLAEEAARQRAEAERLAQENQIEAAVQVAEAAQKTEAQAAAPSVARTTGALGGSLGSVTRWDFTIDDVTKLPAQFLLPNTAAIRAWMNGQTKAKTTPALPGVTFKQVTSTTGR